MILTKSPLPHWVFCKFGFIGEDGMQNLFWKKGSIFLKHSRLPSLRYTQLGILLVLVTSLKKRYSIVFSSSSLQKTLKRDYFIKVFVHLSQKVAQSRARSPCRLRRGETPFALPDSKGAPGRIEDSSRRSRGFSHGQPTACGRNLTISTQPKFDSCADGREGEPLPYNNAITSHR